MEPERILIIWLSPTGLQRAVFELPYGDMVEASRIFEKITRMMLVEKEKKQDLTSGSLIRFWRRRKKRQILFP